MNSNLTLKIGDTENSGEEEFRHPNAGYTSFCKALIDNRLNAGMTLTQGQLSDVLGISLSPLRETLVLLEEYGLVEIKPRAGIRIFYPDVSFIRQNMQFRTMIEEFALPVFIRNISQNWAIDMRTKHIEIQNEWLAAKQERDDLIESKSQHLDRLFHANFVEALGNDSIKDTHERIGHNVFLAQKVHQTSFGKSHYLDTIKEHLLVIDAIEDGDANSAVAALGGHFRSAAHRLFIAP